VSSEYLRHNWATLHAREDVTALPQTLQILARAQTTEDAERYYHRIDNKAFVQDSVYEASYPLVTCIMQELLRCTPVSREYLLDILDQICNGEPAPEELALGNTQIVERCVQELSRGISSLFDILEHGTEMEVYWSVNLLFTCWVYDRSLAERVIWWYRRLLSSYPEDHSLVALLHNCLYSIEMNDPDAEREQS
jgi:hypothetical protein